MGSDPGGSAWPRGVYFRAMQTDRPKLLDRLRTVDDLSARVPRLVSLGLGLVLLALAVLIDWLPSPARPAFPLYYLIPIGILAWFLGWRVTWVAVVIAAGSSSVGLLFHGSLATSSTGFLLGRALAFSLVLLIGRVLAVLRQMLAYYLLGDHLRARIVPIRIGPRLVSIPTRDPEVQAHDFELGPDDIALLIRPGTAFGSGSHATTQMCLMLLEDHLKPGQVVFDFGSGSGILSIAAAKLGASRVYAVDISKEAEGVIHENITLNKLDDVIRFRRASWPSFLDPPSKDGWLTRDGSVGSTDQGPVKADLLLANILTHALVEALQEGLTRCVMPGGKLILSGIRIDQKDEMRKALDEAGLAIGEWRQILKWLAVVAFVAE